MPRPTIGGWPDHWYTDASHTHIFCQARGCDKVFNEDEFVWRDRHYRTESQNPFSTSRSDHDILLAINEQYKCVHCSYHDKDLQNLLAHEETKHGTSKMSTVQGWLYLLRRGVAVNGSRAYEDPVYERLLDNIWNSPHREYRNRLLFRVYPELLPKDAWEGGMWRYLDPILAHQNIQSGRPHANVILAEHFLIHLRPESGDLLAWRDTYHELRARYAEGSI